MKKIPFLKKYIALFQERKFLKRTLACFLIASSIVFFIFSLFNTILISNSYQDEIIAFNEKNLQQANKLSDELLGKLYSRSFTALQYDFRLLSLIYGDEFTTQDHIACNPLLNEIMSFSKLIDSAYLINYSTQTVLASFRGKGNFRLPLEEFSDQDILSIIRNSDPERGLLLFIPRVTQNPEKEIFSLVFYRYNKGAMVLNFDSQIYNDMVNADSVKSSVHTIFFNRYGEIFSGSAAQELLSLDSQTLLQEIEAEPSSQGTFSYCDSSGKYFVSYIKDAAYGIRYCSLFRENIFDKNNHLLRYHLPISFGFLLVSFVLSIVFSFLIYKPVHRLTENLGENPLQKGENEFDALESAYKRLIQRSKKAESDQNDKRKAEALRKLIFRSAGLDTMNTIRIEECNLDLPYQIFRVFIFSFDRPSALVNANENIDLLKFGSVNIIKELFSSHCKLEYIRENNENLTFLINYDLSDEKKMLKRLETAQHYISQYLEVSISCGIGCRCEELDFIHESYSSAKSALASRFTLGNGIMIDSASLPRKEAVPYPYELEHQLISAVKKMQYRETADLVHQFFSWIRELDPPHAISYCFEFIAHINFLTEQFSEDYVLDLHALESEDSFTLEKVILHHLNQMMATGENQKRKTDTKVQFIDEIIEMIHQDIREPNFSVEYLANKVNFSVNYLRSLFKENMGVSLSNYIVQEKLKYVCQLLAETDMSIEEISDTVGFSTKNYFFTFFKKHTGMTPLQYRQTHSK